MAEITTNFGLVKPLPEEFYDVNVQNGNMDIIDEKLKEAFESSGGTPEKIGALRQDAIYYPASTEKSIDDIRDGLALVAISSSLNSELYGVLGGSFAYIMTLTYEKERFVQVSWSYNTTKPRMAIRHNTDTFSWTPWKALANADEYLPITTTAKDIGAVACSTPLTMSVTSDGILQITY